MKKHLFLVFLITTFFFISIVSADASYTRAYEILKEAVEQKNDLGARMTASDIHYVLLSVKEEGNIPYLLETLNSDNSKSDKERAFLTLAEIGSSEYEDVLKEYINQNINEQGRLCILLSQANPRVYGGIVQEIFTSKMEQDTLSPDIPDVIKALSILGDKDSGSLIQDFFGKVSMDPESEKLLITSSDLILSLSNAGDVIRRDKFSLELLRSLLNNSDMEIASSAACILYSLGSKREAERFLTGDVLKDTNKFNRHDTFLKIYNEIDAELGLNLLRTAVKEEGLSPLNKIKFLEILASHHDSQAREHLKNIFRNNEENKEKALWLLAVYYNDDWVRDKVFNLYKEDIYWTKEYDQQRAYLAQAYLITANKRSEIFFKRMLSDVNLTKKAYGCEGLRKINARGAKPELKSLFAKMDYTNPQHNPVSFQCARAKFRFGKRHYIKKLVETDKIPIAVKQWGLASLGDSGDEDDIEILKYLLDRIPPELYNAYLYALTRIGRQESFLLKASNKGERQEPLRDTRLLMKEVLHHKDVNFRRMAAEHIELFNYHWQSVPLLMDCVQSSDSQVKIEGILSFRNAEESITVNKAKAGMRRCLTDPDFNVRTAAAAVFIILENRSR